MYVLLVRITMTNNIQNYTAKAICLIFDCAFKQARSTWEPGMTKLLCVIRSLGVGNGAWSLWSMFPLNMNYLF